MENKNDTRGIQMRKLLAFLLLPLSISAQNGRPYAIWEDSGAGTYRYVQLDASTGAKTNIAAIPGLLGFVAGNVSCYDAANNWYHFAALSGPGIYSFYTLDATTGAVVYNPVLTGHVIGLEYNCGDGKVYGLREVSDNYDLITIDPVTANITSVGLIGFLNGYVGGSFSLNTQLGQYTFVALTGTGYRLKTYSTLSGLPLFDVAFPDNVVGHKYSCSDNSTYGLWDNGGVYKMERIDVAAGSHTTIGALTGVSPSFVMESQSMDENGYYTFRGFNTGGSFTLFTVDASTAAVTASGTTSDNAVGFEEMNCCSIPTLVNETTETGIGIFPVPAHQKIQLRSDEKITSMSIFSPQGRLVRQIDDPAAEILVDDLAPGIYFLRINTTSGPQAIRIIIQ